MLKINKKKIMLVIVIIVINLVLLMGKSNASLRSNPNTNSLKDTLDNWMKNIRALEAEGEAMGLQEKINTDLTSSTESNNIDVHMIKSTEYGTMAILSSSKYGNPEKLQDSAIKSTTGNKTGVYVPGDKYEWVAGGIKISNGPDKRYYDEYTKEQTSAKIGDALGTSTTENPGCSGWHSASYSNWCSGSSGSFVRGSGGLFSFNDYVYRYYNYYGRGVAVCGNGF